MKKIIYLLCFVGLFLYLPTNVSGQKIQYDKKALDIVTSWPAKADDKNEGVTILDPLSMKLTPESGKIKYQEAIKNISDKSFNACVLSFLLERPELIPVEWQKYKVVFAGTTFTDSDSNEFQLYLYYWEKKWDIGVAYTSDYFYPDMRIVLKKPQIE